MDNTSFVRMEYIFLVGFGAVAMGAALMILHEPVGLSQVIGIAVMLGAIILRNVAKNESVSYRIFIVDNKIRLR